MVNEIEPTSPMDGDYVQLDGHQIKVTYVELDKPSTIRAKLAQIRVLVSEIEVLLEQEE
jgi:hypothetical protein